MPHWDLSGEYLILSMLCKSRCIQQCETFTQPLYDLHTPPTVLTSWNLCKEELIATQRLHDYNTVVSMTCYLS